MSTKRGSQHRPRPWQPMGRAEKRQPTAEQVAAARDWATSVGQDPDEVAALMTEDAEMWKNDRYTVSVDRNDDGSVNHLSIRRNDRKPDMPWRHLQRIKNEIAGDDVEAVELFPAESRLVDTANQRWLWCARPGVHLEVGFNYGRHVTGPEDIPPVINARQSAFEAQP